MYLFGLRKKSYYFSNVNRTVHVQYTDTSAEALRMVNNFQAI